MGVGRGILLQVATGIVLSTATISMALRCYARAWIMKAFGADDIVMLAALIIYIPLCVAAFVVAANGAGRHTNELAPHEIREALLFFWIGYLAYCPIMALTRLSVGLLLLRITIIRWHRIVIYIAIAMSAIFSISFFFILMLQCSPISFSWNKAQLGTCISIDTMIILHYVWSVASVISDLALSFLPFAIVWSLQISMKYKMMFLPVILTGCISSVSMLARFPYVHLIKDPEFLYSCVEFAAWSVVDPGIAITAGSLATLAPLVREVLQAFNWTRSSRMAMSSTGREGEQQPSGNAADPRHGSRGTTDSKRHIYPAEYHMTLLTRTTESV